MAKASPKAKLLCATYSRGMKSGGLRTAQLGNCILLKSQGSKCATATPYSTRGQSGRCFSKISLEQFDTETRRVFHRGKGAKV